MTIERRPRQFLAVWTDDGTAVKGSTFEESLFVDGAFWKNEITPVAPEDFGDFGTQFSNGLQQQHDTLTTEKKAVDDQYTALQAQVATLESEKAILTTQLTTTTAERDAATTQLATLSARIAELLTKVTFNERHLNVAAFRKRLFSYVTPEKLMQLISNDVREPEVRRIMKILDGQTSANPVRLDSPQVTNLLADLIAVDALTSEQREDVIRNATREEALI